MPTIYKPKKQQQKTGNQYDSERRKIYDSERWKRLRAWKFANSPLCEACLKNDKVSPTEDIHHIVSFMDAGDQMQRKYLAYDYDNLQSLCKQCHGAIHNSKSK